MSAGIPGSVAAAVAAGLPVGGGGAGSDAGGDEMWQVRVFSLYVSHVRQNRI